MTDKSIDPEDEELLNIIPNSEKLTPIDIKRLREKYKDSLDQSDESPEPVKQEEVYHVYNQFSNFVSIQCMAMMARQVTKNRQESKEFIEGLIDTFTTQYKTNLYRGFELQELRQQKSMRVEIIGQELLNRENEQTRSKLNKIIAEFDKSIRKSFHLHEDLNDYFDDEEDDDDGDIDIMGTDYP